MTAFLSEISHFYYMQEPVDIEKTKILFHFYRISGIIVNNLCSKIGRYSYAGTD